MTTPDPDSAGQPLADDPLKNHPGVVRASVDTKPLALTIDYDPAQISEDGVRQAAEELAALGRQQYCRTVLRLQGRASGAAEQRLERKAQKIDGIRRARVTFMGGVMSVTFDDARLTDAQMMQAVRETGAKVTPWTPPDAGERPPTFSAWLRQWFTGERVELLFTILTFVFMISGWLAGRAESPARNWLYLGAYLTGGWFGLRAGLQSLRQWTIDVDILMILAALGAAVVNAPFEGAMLLFLFSLSNVLQDYAIDRTRKAIHSLMKLRPDKALTKRDGTTVLLPVEELVIGDVVIVRPGESIPLDSVILEGRSAVDQASLTGESMPVSKAPGDTVFAGTINQTGGLEIRVAKLARDSAIEKLVRMVEEAQSEKAETQRFLDRAEQYYAIGVILLTIGLIVFPLLAGKPFQEAFYKAMTVMVVASPCALIISTPASILSAIGGAARRGVLFKGGVHLERAATVKVVAFDKTGTLTEGKPRVTDLLAGERVIPFSGPVEESALDLLALVAAVEAKSEHPLAQAIVNEAKARGRDIAECSGFQSTSGKGASGTVNGRRIAVGNARYFESHGIPVTPGTLERIAALQDEGKTVVTVAEVDEHAGTGNILGAIAIADVLRADAVEVVRGLRADGIQRVVMLTGDNTRVAAAIAKLAGVDEFHADLLPEDKVKVIKELKAIGPVAMVGDGVNDAPALATATVGIAMGAAGTDVAMETADIVLMSDNLQNIPFALALARKARQIIIQNLVFSLGVIIVLVTTALGFHLLLPLGVVGHEGSTVLVCLNGLRMLGFKRAARPAAA